MNSVKKSIALSVTLALLAASVPTGALAGAVARGKLISDAGTDPFWNNVTLLAGNDSNITGQTSFVDQSRYIRTLTANGNASTTVATAPTGLTSSMAFDGTGDYLSIPDSSDWVFGANDFTIEGYIRFNVIDGTVYSTGIGQWNGAGSYGWIIQVRSGNWLFGVSTNGGATADVYTFADTLTAGTWYHFTVTRNGSDVKFFRDGSQKGTTQTNSGTVADVAAAVNIGRNMDGNQQYLNGWMAGVRVTKGVARYTSNFTPPTLPLKLGTYEPIVATGGTVTTVGGYKVHTFTSSGTFRVTRGTGHVWYLVVGGGGGGGGSAAAASTRDSGGGGAGGYLTNGIYGYPVRAGDYAITVGNGGSGGGIQQNGSDGGNSVFATITATGGGGGATGPDGAGRNGGSGGGSSGGTGVAPSGGTATSGQGNSGGAGAANNQGGGGGGGAGAVGGNAIANGGADGGSGGNGLTSSITGTSVTRAGGGGGGGISGGAGGGAGGGNGGSNDTNGGNASSATANTGSGGGGAANPTGLGGSGGSGVVIIRYPVAPTTAKAPPSSGLVGWWTLDNADVSDKIYDRSGRGNNGYFFNGATSSAKVAGNVGQALKFDGSQYVQVPNLDSNTFTYVGWVKRDRTGQSGNVDRLLLSVNSGGWGIYFISDGTANKDKIGLTKVGVNNTTSTGSITDTKWHQIAVAYDGSTARFYIDGVLDSSPSYSTTFSSGGGNYTIGSRGAGEYFQGSFDDVRVYNRALSAAEVAALYASNKTVPKVNTAQVNSVTNGLVGYWDFDNKNIYGTTTYDRSGQGNNGTLTNGPTKGIGKIGQALRFDGSDDYIKTESSFLLSGNPSFTNSAWVKANTTSFGAISMIGRDGAKNGEWLYLTGSDFGSGNCTLTASPTPSVKAWHLVTATYDGASHKFYVDGQLNTQVSCSSANITSNPLYIGTYSGTTGSSPNFYFDGAIDEVRIYNRALSAAEVKRLYNIGR